VNAGPTTASLGDAFGGALAELGERDPRLQVFDTGAAAATRTDLFGRKFPDRYFDLGPGAVTMMSRAAGAAPSGGRTVFAASVAEFAAGAAYFSVRQSLCLPGANVKLAAVHGSPAVVDGGAVGSTLEDIGLMRSLPGMTVVVPSDAPTARAATFALADRSGPAYLRLRLGALPVVTDGTFALGRAAELRAGNDLAVVAVGALVTRALELSDELARVGISTRVLDFASVKPFDEPALLRAARDTGAILVLEEHTVLTGVGALVASTTAENYPVPVRRIGIPDLFFAPGGPPDLLDRYGMTKERLRDEAWELLKSRGKVT
jgi:transketolase